MNIAAINKLRPVVGRTFHRSILITKKYSPEILTGIGVVSVVASAVMASKATLKLEPIVDEMSSHMEVAKNTTPSADYTDKDLLRDKTIIITRGVTDIVKLYGPSVTLGLAGIGCIIGAHGIMRKRNVALVAAYKTIESSYAKYRERVIEDLGIEKDREYQYGKAQATVIKDEETGEEKQALVLDPSGISGYARFFDEYNKNWKKTSEYNLLFLNCQQNYANDLLRARGHIFLNDVYDMLGLPRTKEGQIVGWVFDEKRGGDNFVDFGIYNPDNEMAREFVNGYERSILLDFNVDGPILDLI